MLWSVEGIAKAVDGGELIEITLACFTPKNKTIFQFAVLLGIIFIVEIAVGIAALTFRNDLRDILNIQLQKSMNRQNKVGQVRLWNGVTHVSSERRQLKTF